MYAVIKNGGKQYRVTENQVVKLEKLEGNVGDNIKLGNVIALSDGKELKFDGNSLKDSVISAEILEQKKDDKVIIFKKKRRHNYRRKNGHRQQITIVRILDVSGKGEIKKIEKKAKAETKGTSEEEKTESKTNQEG